MHCVVEESSLSLGDLRDWETVLCRNPGKYVCGKRFSVEGACRLTYTVYEQGRMFFGI